MGEFTQYHVNGWQTDSTPIASDCAHHEWGFSGYCLLCGARHPDNKVETTDYEELGKSIGKLVAEKQVAYGDSFGRAGQVLKVLYPNGILPDQYDDMLAVVRIIDKLFRVANDKDAFGESPFRDIAGYGILGAFKGELKCSK